MTTLVKLRAFHAGLAVIAILVYVTGEAGRIHDWLGYVLAGCIVFRLAWAVVGPRYAGISRLVPRLGEISAIRWFNHPAVGKCLLTGVIVSLLVATITGFAIDDRSLGAMQRGEPAFEMPAMVSQARADEGGEEEREDWIEELHEGSSDLMLILVALHVAYILLWRRKLGLYMLFLEGAEQPRRKQAP